jgi:dienelactone hydrolase
MAGLAFLRSRPDVDARRVAVAGHSFGGSLTLLVAERDSTVRAALVFGGAAGSWDGSPALRARLGAAARRTTAPVFLIYAANDYTIAPAKTLAAEMERAGKSHRVKIYPPSGRSAEEGHDFVYREVSTWEPDVFAFLDRQLRGEHSSSRP